MKAEETQPDTRNVGLLAHVDAGKTTTTEQMLFLTGRTRALGSVDAGTAQTDWLDVERERGISVRMATTVLPWQGCAINLVDTPGHVDFVAEVERAFQVLDGAVLIVSAAEGVQSHTETLWHALRAMHIPTLLFVNKMDRVGADPEARAGRRSPRRSPTVSCPCSSRSAVAEGFSGVVPLADEALGDRLADLDTAVLERYVEQWQRGPRLFCTSGCAIWCRRARRFPLLYRRSQEGHRHGRAAGRHRGAICPRRPARPRTPSPALSSSWTATPRWAAWPMCGSLAGACARAMSCITPRRATTARSPRSARCTPAFMKTWATWPPVISPRCAASAPCASAMCWATRQACRGFPAWPRPSSACASIPQRASDLPRLVEALAGTDRRRPFAGPAVATRRYGNCTSR